MKYVTQILRRVIILLIGLSLGYITIMPNVMVGDSGTKKAITASYIGLCASLFMATGGVVGALFNNPIFLLPGIFLQFFLLFYITYEMGWTW